MLKTLLSQHVERHPHIPELCYGLLPLEMADPSVKEVTPIVVKRCERGYYATDWKWAKEHAVDCLNEMNQRLGVSQDMAEQMQAWSMFEWPGWVYAQHEEALDE